MINISTLLLRWAKASEVHWSTIPGHPEWGVYGTGYNGWGVQTTQKYMAAMAALARFTPENDIRDWCVKRTLAALRFNLASHNSGDFHCTDGTKWGHTWISALGIERMMFGVHLLRPYLNAEDTAALRRVLISEAEWLRTDYRRGTHADIKAGQWAADGCNDPESNIWNGALLWRTAQMYPDHPHAADWKERAYQFFINGVSVPSDATNMKIVDEKPVAKRFIGANFFPHYALDHHGYLNVGYMIICMSNAAILHFDLKAQQLPQPQSLHHHQADLWNVLRRMIFADGRLARIGGDTRVRYAYCQDYQIPTLLYAADHLRDGHAMTLLEHQLALIQRESEDAADSSFYGNRLAHLARENPLYYTRLESDRACALGMLLTYRELVNIPQKPSQSLEISTDGKWCEPEHGAVLHHSATRFASFAWRASGLAQGLCLPPHDGHLAEWEHNLAGSVEFADFPNPQHFQRKSHRALQTYSIKEFEGGFITSGSIIEGTDITLAEGWKATDSAVHHIVFVALPDDHTVVGLQFCRMGARRGYVKNIKGMQYNLPNDLYNAYQRTITTAGGKSTFTCPPPAQQCLALHGKWANIENKIGVVGIYGAENFSIFRHPHRRAGALHSLFVEEICFPGTAQTTKYEADEIILDAGWAVLSSADTNTTLLFSRHCTKVLLPNDFADLRAVRVVGTDGGTYIIIVNWGKSAANLLVSHLGTAAFWDIAGDKAVTETVSLNAKEAKVLLIK